MPEDFKNTVYNTFLFLMAKPGVKWLLRILVKRPCQGQQQNCL